MRLAPRTIIVKLSSTVKGHPARNDFRTPLRRFRNNPTIARLLPHQATIKHRAFGNYSTMSSDQDYEDFLNKANQDSSEAKSTAQSKSKSMGMKSVNTTVPKSLEKVDEIFVSDSDEPFEPVSLKYEGDEIPSADELSKLVGKEVMKISQKDFDPRGQYKSVTDAVKQEIGGGDLGFFQVELDRTRSEYFVVGVDAKHRRIVGLKALSVES